MVHEVNYFGIILPQMYMQITYNGQYLSVGKIEYYVKSNLRNRLTNSSALQRQHKRKYVFESDVLSVRKTYHYRLFPLGISHHCSGFKKRCKILIRAIK